jgi:hypothetical protein
LVHHRDVGTLVLWEREVEGLEKLMSLERRADTKVPVLLRLMVRVEPGEMVAATAVMRMVRPLMESAKAAATSRAPVDLLKSE